MSIPKPITGKESRITRFIPGAGKGRLVSTKGLGHLILGQTQGSSSKEAYSLLGTVSITVPMGKKETGRDLDPLYHPSPTYRDFPEGYHRPPVTSFND